MKSIPTTPLPDKVILIHNGALGDFLLIWPAIRAIRLHSPGADLLWAGAADRLSWLSPLGVTFCPPQVRRSLDRLHGLDAWPKECDGAKTFWFVVDREPDVPRCPSLTFLHALGEGLGPAHVRDRYSMELAQAGVPTAPGWLKDFRRLFAQGHTPSDTVLLFPGAGHPLKQWPLVQFFRLADMLSETGLKPLFVLGPAERERGLVPQGREHVTPGSLEELRALLLTSRMAVGGDTGPMHLAGMLGVPGVSLFGPTSFAKWGPVGMKELSLGLPCSPCTAACADLDCHEARCLGGISARQVFEGLELVEKESKIGFQGPGIP